MNSKKTLGIVLLIGGIAMLVASNYIKGEVAEGRMKIDRAQRQVDTGSKLFSNNPISQEVGKTITGGAQRKINEANQEAGYYGTMAGQLQIGGIILIVAGAAIFFLWKRKS
jgi:hypothetical protein